MKIISQPDVSGWKLKHECSKCDSVLEIEAHDLQYKYYSGDQRDYSSASESFTCNCIVCGNVFYVANDSIPKLIQIEAKKRSETKSYGSGSYFDR